MKAPKDWQHLESNWDQLRTEVVRRWEKLTPEDLERSRGRRDHLESRLQAAYGLERDQARKEVDEFCRSL